MNISVVIPSKTTANLTACVQSILKNEPKLKPAHIIVVDDGVDWSSWHRCGIVSLPGEKPFVFARNVNAGIEHALEEQRAEFVIIMNDDATLLTPGGFTALARVAAENTEYGTISAAITAAVGNPCQKPRGTFGLREEARTLAYICVGFTAATLHRVGLLDEDFSEDYGWEDNAHCREVKLRGLKLGIFDGCHVEHGRLKSTFRDNNRSVSIYNANARVFLRKYGDLCGVAIPDGWR